MKYRHSSAFALLCCLPISLSLSACSEKYASAENTAPLQLSSQVVSKSANTGVLINSTNTPEKTILVGDQLQIDDQSLALQSEFVDLRDHWVATLSDDNRLALIDSNTHTIRYSDPLPYSLETFCLFQDNGLQVFLLDENQLAHQMLIQPDDDTVQLTHIRSLAMPPASEYCVADDVSQRLFVSEENIGVWSYNARAESEVIRTPVALVKPYGRLEENSGPLAISHHQLWIAEAGSNRLHSLPLTNVAASISSYVLADTVEIDTLSVSAQANSHTNTVFILDDRRGELLTTRIHQAGEPQKTASILSVAATAETEPVTSRGDAADDPAIWVHPTTPEKSRILGTDKQSGLHVYDLNGANLQTLQSGRVNNVDVRQGFYFKGQPMDIAAASQRDHNSIALYRIDPASGQVTPASEITTTLDEVYGFCMGRGQQGEMYAFINDEDGRFEQYQIIDSERGWYGKRVRKFSVASQPEGCVSDDSQQRLFLGEENHAIWTLDLSDHQSQLQPIQPLDSQHSNLLYADIEGMDIYHGNHRSYLVVSSQGNDSYVVFDAQPPYALVGNFRVGMNIQQGSVIDGASETDGLAVSSAYLGENYPEGLLVVQDGRNLMPGAFQNFKLVSWQAIRNALKLK